MTATIHKISAGLRSEIKRLRALVPVDRSGSVAKDTDQVPSIRIATAKGNLTDQICDFLIQYRFSAEGSSGVPSILVGADVARAFLDPKKFGKGHKSSLFDPYPSESSTHSRPTQPPIVVSGTTQIGLLANMYCVFSDCYSTEDAQYLRPRQVVITDLSILTSKPGSSIPYLFDCEWTRL